MKKLKRKTFLKYLERVRGPNGMKLKEIGSSYAKLLKKYAGRDVKIIEKRGYYSGGGLWIVEWQTESVADLAKRQAKHDKQVAMHKARIAKYRAQMKLETIKRRAQMKKEQAARKAVAMERKVEEVKTMVEVLRLAGYSVSAAKVSTASKR